MGTRNENLNLHVGARDKGAKKVLKGIQSQVMAVGAAYLGWRVAKDVIGQSISNAMDYRATLQSLNAVAGATGRDINQIYVEMQNHLDGLANKSQIASGFLKGMTTELSIDQVSRLTTAIKDASIAMGEDFGQQFPLIIKAIKQLNPAILDNIGVTVRLDQVNKRIREGFYGAGRAINEYTQQNAIFQEVMRQTAKFHGQEAELLDTEKGKWLQTKAELHNVGVAFGDLAIEIGAVSTALGILGENGIVGFLEELTTSLALADYSFTVIGLRIKAFWEAITFQLDDYRKTQDDIFIAEVGWSHKLAVLEGRLKDIREGSKGGGDGGDDGGQGERILAAETEAETFNRIMQDYFWNRIEQGRELTEAEEKLAQERMDAHRDRVLAMKEFEQIALDERLIGLDEFSQEVVLLEQWMADQFRMIDENEYATASERRQARFQVERVYQDRLLQLNKNRMTQQKAMEQAFVDEATQILSGFVDDMIDSMLDGEKDMAEIFDNMAKDFAKFFIKQGLALLADSFVPGLGRILGGIFDTPKYDRLAMEQGEHFIEWFNEGMIGRYGETVGASMADIVEDIMNGPLDRLFSWSDELMTAYRRDYPERPSQNMASGWDYLTVDEREARGSGLQPSGRESTVINNNYYGVVSEDFIRRDVVPKVELASKRKEVAIVGVDDPRFGDSSVFS